MDFPSFSVYMYVCVCVCVRVLEAGPASAQHYSQKSRRCQTRVSSTDSASTLWSVFNNCVVDSTVCLCLCACVVHICECLFFTDTQTQSRSGRLALRLVCVQELDQRFSDTAETFNEQQERFEVMTQHIIKLRQAFGCNHDNSLSLTECVKRIIEENSEGHL